MTPHLLGGIGLAGVIACCFQAQRSRIRQQQGLISDLLAAVYEVRRSRGLDVEPQPPAVVSTGG